MAGSELANEGFKDGQVGSSAMPHKMNSSACERINGLHIVIKGFLTMGAALAGDQWNEGDVACSVVRRVMLPSAFLALDGLLETTIVVSTSFQPSLQRIQSELEHYFPFLVTSTILMEAVKGGIGRETAHAIIKEHAVAVAKESLYGIPGRSLGDRLHTDGRLGLSAAQIQAILSDVRTQTGDASWQVDNFCRRVEKVVADQPDAGNYRPGNIL
jgi:adenylosuccinate lyase